MMNASPTSSHSVSFSMALLVTMVALCSLGTTVAFHNNFHSNSISGTKAATLATVAAMHSARRVQQRRKRTRSFSFSSLLVTPTDVTGATAVLPIQYDLIRNAVTTASNAQAEFLSDVSSVVMNVPTFFFQYQNFKATITICTSLGKDHDYWNKFSSESSSTSSSIRFDSVQFNTGKSNTYYALYYNTWYIRSTVQYSTVCNGLM